MAEQMLYIFEGNYQEEFMAQYKIKDGGILDGIVIFIIYTKT
jgi:hypothetical protein